MLHGVCILVYLCPIGNSLHLERGQTCFFHQKLYWQLWTVSFFCQRILTLIRFCETAGIRLPFKFLGFLKHPYQWNTGFTNMSSLLLNISPLWQTKGVKNLLSTISLIWETTITGKDCCHLCHLVCIKVRHRTYLYPEEKKIHTCIYLRTVIIKRS